MASESFDSEVAVEIHIFFKWNIEIRQQYH